MLVLNTMLIGLETIALSYISGGLQDISTCRFDRYKHCGIVDRSLSASRWAIVAEDYSVNSTSKFLRSNIH